MAEAYATGGKRVLRDSTGSLVTVNPDEASRLLEQGDGQGRSFFDVDSSEVEKERQKAQAGTLGGQVSTVARGVTEGLYDVAKGAANITQDANRGMGPGMQAIQLPQTAQEQQERSAFMKQGLLEATSSAQAGADVRNAGGTEDAALAAESLAGARERSQLAVQEEVNPLLAGGSRIVGQSLPFLAVPGVGSASGALARMIPGTAGKIAATTAGKLAIEGAIEGAVEGGVLASADPDADAENILGSIGMGALLGGGVGGGIGGVGMAAGGAMRAAGAALDVAGKGVKWTGGKLSGAIEGAAGFETGTLAKQYREMSSKLTRVDQRVMDTVGPWGTRTQEAIKAHRNIKDLTNTAALELQPKIGKMIDDLHEVTETVTKRSLKKASVAEQMADIIDDTELHAIARKTTEEASDKVVDLLDEIATRKVGAGNVVESTTPTGLKRERFSQGVDAISSPSVRKQLSKAAREIQASRAALNEATDLSDIFIATDSLKRTNDASVKSLRQFVNGKKAAAELTVGERDAIMHVLQEVESNNDVLRMSLEDPSIYGEAAANSQRGINKLWTGEVPKEGGKKVGGVSGLQDFNEFMRATRQTDFATGRTVKEGDASALVSYFDNLGKATNDVRERAMRDFLDQPGKLIDEIAKHHNLEPELLKQLESTRATMAEVQQKVAYITDQKSLANDFETLLQAESQSGSFGTGAAIAGGLIGGPIGAAAGVVGGALLRPATIAKIGEAVSGVTKSFQGTAIKSVGTWISSGATKVGETASSYRRALVGASKDIGTGAGTRRVRRAVSSASIAAFLGESGDMREAYELRKFQMKLLEPSEVVSDMLIAGFPPNVAVSAAEVSERAATYLSSLMPEYRKTNALRPGIKMPPSFAEIQEYSLAWGAISQPETVVSDLMAGTVTPTQVKALQAVYPRMYDSLRTTVVSAVERSDAMGKRVPAYVSDNLAILFNEPQLASLSDSAADNIKGVLQLQEQQQAAPPPEQTSTQMPSQEYFS